MTHNHVPCNNTATTLQQHCNKHYTFNIVLCVLLPCASLSLQHVYDFEEPTNRSHPIYGVFAVVYVHDTADTHMDQFMQVNGKKSNLRCRRRHTYGPIHASKRESRVPPPLNIFLWGLTGTPVKTWKRESSICLTGFHGSGRESCVPPPLNVCALPLYTEVDFSLSTFVWRTPFSWSGLCDITQESYVKCCCKMPWKESVFQKLQWRYQRVFI